MKVLVTGARGQLAGAIIEAYEDSAQVLAYPRAALDIADFDAVMSRTQADRPDVITNCAAYNNVDGAEDEADKLVRQLQDNNGIVRLENPDDDTPISWRPSR